MATNMRMYRKPGYDVMKDFIARGRITRSDVVLVVAAESGINSAKELIEARAQAAGQALLCFGRRRHAAHMGAELILKKPSPNSQAMHGALPCSSAIFSGLMPRRWPWPAASATRRCPMAELLSISVPARTPDPIVAKIHAAFEEALRQPAVVIESRAF
jgi:tripartite-type tricarboxylate transporter receptor subunit TctC